MTTIAAPTGAVTIGVDTHMDVHVAAALDGLGRMLGTAGFATSPAGNAELIRWAEQHGKIAQVGVEGTGSYGAQLARDLQQAGHQVIEVDRPDRKARRARGKDDQLKRIDKHLTALVSAAAPSLVARHATTARLQRQDHRPAPPQPGRRPTGQQRALAHRAGPHGHRPTHQGLRRPAHRPGPQQARDHAMPQALRRPRSLHCDPTGPVAPNP